MTGHNHNSCKVWRDGQKAGLWITWAPHFLSSFAVSPFCQWHTFTPSLASLCLSLPLFLILHIFPFPFLCSTCSLIHLSSSSPPQSSSALAVSSTPRCTLFFNRGGGWARYRERRERGGREGESIIYTIIHAKRTLQLAPTLVSLSVPQPPLRMPNILCVI